MSVAGFILLASPYQYKGSWIQSPNPAPDFVLTDQNGNPFHLSSLRGQVVVLFFGYTHCPDVCPTTLAQFRQVKAGLSNNAGFRFVLVSVDPERDTPAVLKKYLAAFDPTFIGLTGDPAALEKVWADYGITVQKTDIQSAEDYAVEHTDRVYVIDTKGNLQLTYPSGFDTAGIIADLSHLRQASR